MNQTISKICPRVLLHKEYAQNENSILMPKTLQVADANFKDADFSDAKNEGNDHSLQTEAEKESLRSMISSKVVGAKIESQVSLDFPQNATSGERGGSGSEGKGEEGTRTEAEEGEGMKREEEGIREEEEEARREGRECEGNTEQFDSKTSDGVTSHEICSRTCSESLQFLSSTSSSSRSSLASPSSASLSFASPSSSSSSASPSSASPSFASPSSSSSSSASSSSASGMNHKRPRLDMAPTQYASLITSQSLASHQLASHQSIAPDSDIMICGKCKMLFTSLAPFIDHKKVNNCRLRFICHCQRSKS